MPGPRSKGKKGKLILLRAPVEASSSGSPSAHMLLPPRPSTSTAAVPSPVPGLAGLRSRARDFLQRAQEGQDGPPVNCEEVEEGRPQVVMNVLLGVLEGKGEGETEEILLPTPQQIASLQQEEEDQAAAFSQLAHCLLPLMGLDVGATQSPSLSEVAQGVAEGIPSAVEAEAPEEALCAAVASDAATSASRSRRKRKHPGIVELAGPM
eukprot:GGOE01053353.1.p3 GENE.GGOE01053353.1~~GGOE01053353.1.p3  ORF type:complete len:208 (+),score=53.05 GGOE01053353.1:312-935(+)